MSDNTLPYDSQNVEIRNQRQCLDPSKKGDLKLYDFTKSHDDSCFVTEQGKQSVAPGRYQTFNSYHCECKVPKVVETATSIPNVFFKNGYGINGCVVDDDTKTRVGKTRRYPKCPQQLHERPYRSVPYMGRGAGNMYLESQITPGENTREKRQCNTLSGISIDNYFTPLVPHLQENVQAPVHILPEEAMSGWVRGGAPSRLVVQDIDYLSRCGYNYLDKDHGSEFWQDKHLSL